VQREEMRLQAMKNFHHEQLPISWNIGTIGHNCILQACPRNTCPIICNLRSGYLVLHLSRIRSRERSKMNLRFSTAYLY